MSTKRVIVVDDDPSIRFLFRLILESAGYLVTEAQHGVAALLRIKQEIPDVVVTDMHMPVMDGGALIKHLRSDPRTASLPILVVTSHPEAEQEAVDANAVLRKPFAHSSLVAAVTSLLGMPELGAA